MARPKITLWLLNRIVHWNRDLLVATLIDRFQVQLGRRVLRRSGGADFLELDVNALEDGAPGELMHEGANLPEGSVTEFDEYFMPIPLKCAGTLGTTFWNGVASPDGLRRLEELRTNLAARFPPGNEFSPSDAKKKIGPHFGEVQMNLVDRSIGYYQRPWTELTTRESPSERDGIVARADVSKEGLGALGRRCSSRR